MDTNYNFILLSSQKIILIERDDGRKKQVMEKKETSYGEESNSIVCLSRESLSVPMASAVLCWTMAHMCNIHIGHS